MMKIAFGVTLLLVALLLARFWWLARKSAEIVPALGVSGDRLRPCDSASNCASSTPDKSPWYYPPLRRTGTAGEFLDAATRAVESLGGAVRRREVAYLHAEFRSALFGFVDDVELLVDASGDGVQVRSASRVGKSDLGANRKRLDRLRAALGQ